jgi:excinuclease UvrABC helicase subunit UvrB
MKTINFVAYTEDPTHEEAIKAFMKALKIKFELTKDEDKLYNSDFVNQIKKADIEFADGKGIKMSVEEFKTLCE